MSEESYFKEVKKGTFIIGWIPFLVIHILCGFLICLLIVLALCILSGNFAIREYLFGGSFLKDYSVLLLGSFVLGLWEGRKTYRLVKEKPFASISHDKLLLNFGKDSFLWDRIQSVNLEGERKLTVISDDKDTSKNQVNDLKWLPKKKEFIHNLKDNCIERNISYVETEMTLSSRIGLFFRIIGRYTV
ncbi:MAG: hypothetical protein HXS48_21610 [Theionarchaea archaeon]|nr:hypothetical protein [Theionarchaea archaeon]